MKRKTKNIVMIFSILVLCIISFFVMKDIDNSSNNKIFNENMEHNRNLQNLEEEGENIKQKSETDIKNSENEEESENSEEETKKHNERTVHKKEENDEFKLSETNDNLQRKMFKNEMTKDNKLDSKDISLKYYIIFICLGLMISLIIMYLIMSKFNKISFKETFNSIDNIIIYILASIIITGILIFLQSNLTKNYFFKSDLTNRSLPLSRESTKITRK